MRNKRIETQPVYLNTQLNIQIFEKIYSRKNKREAKKLQETYSKDKNLKNRNKKLYFLKNQPATATSCFMFKYLAEVQNH